MSCPKCKSTNTYFDGIDNACRTCGSRWLRTFVKTAALPATENKSKEQIMGKNPIRACRNCGRIKPILGDGLDSSCYWSVYKKFTKGSPEYDAALAKAKIKFTDPNYKRSKSVKPKIKTLKTILNSKEPQKVMPFFPHKDPDKITALDMLIAERNGYQDRIFKINQAIELLS